MGNDDLRTQTDVGEKYNLEGMRMNHTPGNRRIFHRYSCFVSIEESRWGELDIAPVTNIGRSDIYFAISKSRPDIKDTLDSAMRRIRDDNPFYTDELYQRCFSAQASAFLSSEEKEWLAQHGDIRIGYLNNDTGVSVLNQITGKLTATRKIRALERADARTIPIIAMTANVFREDANQCIEAGMNAHLTKPLEIEKVKRTICEQIALCSQYNRIKED